jgi:hypothetical protein
MGDKSPKAARKQASQKSAKAERAEQQKKPVVTAMQELPKRK